MTEFCSDIKIEANKDQIKQVFLNILLNSIDAVKQKDKPRKVVVSCQKEDEEIIVNISNNGPIIPHDTLNTIFEPFYTTKELGTGIGLFVCKNIIEKHNGDLVCQSDDRKTTFSIHLPIVAVP
jgi:signal transduction histidine kinase